MTISDQQEDLRLVYLALHNIVKYRGNFLYEDEEGLKASNANAGKAAEALDVALQEYFGYLNEALDRSLSCSVDLESLQVALESNKARSADIIEAIVKALHFSDAKMAKAVATACVGRKVEFSTLFLDVEKQEGTNFSLSDDEKTEGFLSLCSDAGLPLFEALQSAYSAFILSGLLRGFSSLSEAMIASYERHQEDLFCTKGLVRDYFPDEYNRIFRGPKDVSGDYNINKLPKTSYTAYVLGNSLANKMGCSQEDLQKRIRELFDSCTDLKSDERYKTIEERLNSDDGSFLAKQKTRANGAIPYQLHLEEFEAIIDKQGKYYPFLVENRDLLCKVVSSRIPYYVGPLNAAPDPHGPFPKNNVDPSRKFAWSVRKPGMEHEEAHPWNVDEVIDVDATAERFIQRMTGTCTYLMGEPVLPKCSLLYEEFCVLNELNGARWSCGGGNYHRFDAADREGVVQDLFKKRKGVSYKAVAKWLERNNNTEVEGVKGGQGESGFESKLNSYNDFCKILGVESLEDSSCALSVDEIEQIILWNTVFEDRAILKRKLQNQYGDRLSDKQIRDIVKKRYTGWGRLSKKLLSDIKIGTPFGPMGIIGILREGDPITGHHNNTMVFMEVLSEKQFGFKELIDQINNEYVEANGMTLTPDDMSGSPALRRSVNQAMRIIEEIVHIAGKAPARICVEETRDDDFSKKGKRTDSRFNQLQAALKAYDAESKEANKSLLDDLRDKKDRLDEEKLMLYFIQRGKSLYSQKPLDINNLDKYQVDHIIPQAYIKDDSLDNKALVLQEENQRKLDSLLLDRGLIERNRAWWSELHRAHLISDKKYNNLTCTNIGDRKLTGFINRQLVETSQIVKFVRQMCELKYPDTEIVTVRASLSHEVRERCGLPKVRELNDYHHAHDAYLACQMGRFVGIRYPQWQDGFMLQIIRDYVKGLQSDYKKGRFTPGKSGFIVDSFMRNGINRKTGEVWEAEKEIAQMRKVFSYPKIFLSRMTFEQTGAFWNETLYSPKDMKHKVESLAPQKGFGTDRMLDPAKYGGFDNTQQAYFFIFTAKDKKGRDKYFFEGVPIHLIAVIARNTDTLREYAERLANGAGCHDAKVLRAKVPLRQLFELNGDRYFLCGRSGKTNEIRPAEEIAANPDFTQSIKEVLEQKVDLDSQSYLQLVMDIDARLEKSNARSWSALALESRKDKTLALDAAGQSSLLRNVLMYSKGSSKGCDLASVGGVKSTGFILKNLASVMDEIIWIDQSVTGIFERRTTLQDMLNGI